MPTPRYSLRGHWVSFAPAAHRSPGRAGKAGKMRNRWISHPIPSRAHRNPGGIMAAPLDPIPTAEPRFSVVILLPGDRGVLEACLAGWSRQRYPRGQYEVLGVSDG